MTNSIRCATRNNYITIKEKFRRAHTSIKELNFEDITLLQEIGKFPLDDFMFHHLYMVFYTCTHRHALGVPILLRRVSGMQLDEQHVTLQ